MKRLFPIMIILALLLTGCGAYTPIEATPAPQQREDYTFSAETMPQLACAPSLYPMGTAVGAALLGVTREEGAENVSSGVSDSVWKTLAEGGCGVALAPDTGETAGVLTAEVARDALVFFVSTANRVTDLTAQQLVDICTGKITNWKQVGGADKEIRLFTKNASSGSQAAFESLVLSGKKSADAVTALTGGGDEAPAPFDGSEGAIGFGSWYYEDVMGMAEDCRILKIDGVAPTAESIASGEYLYIVSCLAGIPESAAADSPEYILWQWLQSSAGARLIASQGYVTAK